MKAHFLIVLIVVTNIFTFVVQATDLSCEVAPIDEGQSQYMVAAAHRYKNMTNDGKRVVYFRASQPYSEWLITQQIFSFHVDNPSQVIQVSHDLADGEFIGDYYLLPDNLHIVYKVVSDPTFDSQIYVARLDRPETFHIMTIPSNNAGWLWIPHFYFDVESQENWIVFHDPNYNLHTYDVTSQRFLRLSRVYSMNYYLSPTEPIVYYSDVNHQIYVARLDDTDVKSTGYIGHINQVSEDGNWLLISPPYEIDALYQVYALNTDFNSAPRLIYESYDIHSNKYDFISENEVVITIMDTDDLLFERHLLNLLTGDSVLYNDPHPMENLPNAPWRYTLDGQKIIFGGKQGFHILTVNGTTAPLYLLTTGYDFILDDSDQYLVYFEENESNIFTLVSYNIATDETTILHRHDEFKNSTSYVDRYPYFTRNGYVYYTINDNLYRVLIDGSETSTLIGEFNRPFYFTDSKDFVFFADVDNVIFTVSTDSHMQTHELDEGQILYLDNQSVQDVFYYMKDDDLHASTFNGATFPLLSDINPYPLAQLIERDSGQDLLIFSNPIGSEVTQVHYVSCDK